MALSKGDINSSVIAIASLVKAYRLFITLAIHKCRICVERFFLHNFSLSSFTIFHTVCFLLDSFLFIPFESNERMNAKRENEDD